MNPEEFDRLPAVRAFTGELKDVRFEKKGEGTRDPRYVVLPTGSLAGRVFLVGVLLEKDEVGNGVWRLRIADPTGSISAYAGRYQPDALESIISIEPPALVAITAKMRVLERDGKEIPVLSLEEIEEVDRDTQVNWVIDTARATLNRIRRVREHEDDIVKEAVRLYGGETGRYLNLAKNALEAVFGMEGGIEKEDRIDHDTTDNATGKEKSAGGNGDIAAEAPSEVEKAGEEVRDATGNQDENSEELWRW